MNAKEAPEVLAILQGIVQMAGAIEAQTPTGKICVVGMEGVPAAVACRVRDRIVEAMESDPERSMATCQGVVMMEEGEGLMVLRIGWFPLRDSM